MAVSCWTKEVREVSYDMEDFIDEYEHVRSRAPTAPRRYRKVTRQRRRSKMTLPYSLREQLRQRLWMANKIREFSVRAQDVLRRYADYNLASISADASGAGRADTSSSSWHPAPCWRDNLLVGIDSSVDKLEEWLMTMDSEEHQKLGVVSVVGSGGVGKTTLANEMYRKLGHRFDCRAFVRTSQKPDMRKLFISMLSQLGLLQTPDDWNVHNLISIIRYLILFDDLWCTSTWDIIKCALPDGNNCSRILTMTEVEDLALHSCGYDSTYVLKVTPLCEDESRKLFFCSLFGPHCECPPEFREVSYDIIRKCDGLPLTITMVASLLACQKQNQEKWDHVNKSLGCSLIINPTREGMEQVISLSYYSLPVHLKACMLYMSIYQEDDIIWKDDLVNQWAAQGFICASRGKDEQEIAAAYFDELVCRKILQPVNIKDDGEVLSCVVHHMVLNHIAAHKSIEENFATAIHNSQTTTILADKICRLSLHFGNAEDAILPASMRLSQVRTIAFFGVFKCMPSIVEFRLLQVLILYLWGDKGNISVDLTRISELFRLRYLKVASNVTLELKTRMQGLKKLETIEVDAKVCAIPSEITQLIGLLHLSLPAETDVPSGISHITSLRTLRHFDISSNSIENIQSLCKLSNLRDLQLTCSTKQPDYLNNKIHILLSSILQRLNNLKALTLLPTASSCANSLDQSVPTGIIVSIDDISNAFKTLTLLQRLEFSPHICIFSYLPKCIGKLTKLCILKIGVGKIFSNCFDILKGLPALSVLSLYVHYKPAETIVIEKAGFPVLSYFKFRCCDPMLKFETHAMPNLRKLTLGFNTRRADQQVTVPVGIEHLPHLKEVYAKVGGAGSEERDKRATESALKDAIRVHARCTKIIVTCVNKVFGCKEDQSDVLREEEHATLKQCKMKEVLDEDDQIIKDHDKEAVEHADNRFMMLSEWNMLLLLRNKLDNQHDDITSGIPVIGTYSVDPLKLSDTEIDIETGEPRVFFRPLQEAKDGPAPSGYWTETEPTGYIYSAKRIPIGMKKTMEFYQGRAQSGKRTIWKMKEFTALREATPGAVDARLMERGEMSLCQLYIEPKTISAASCISERSCGDYGILQSVSTNEEADSTKRWRLKPKIRKTVTTNLDDGFPWRKYGQKDILGAKHSRSYYRCAHRNSQGCTARKQMQPMDDDPSRYAVVYYGDHSCREVDRALQRPEQRLSTGGVSSAAPTCPESAAPTSPAPRRARLFPRLIRASSSQ